MSTNCVVKKIVTYITVKLVSPLCISSGDGEQTDNDVVRDWEGNPLIPGTSLAGAMRGYLGFGQDENCIFGFGDGKTQQGRMSSVYISDVTFQKGVKTTVRDGVALNERKVAISGAKFDMEVIDSGAEGSFFIELVIRKNNQEEAWKKQLFDALYGFHKHEIRLGSKKTRGYGEIEITSVKTKCYTKENIAEYQDAYDIDKAGQEMEDVTALWLEEQAAAGKMVCIKVPLLLSGAVSVRQYAAKKGEPDYVHITANGKPVIPGTSITGALRHRIRELLIQMNVEKSKAEAILDNMFGYVKGTEARQSNVIVAESIIEDAVPLTTVRNGISRFEAATKDGALYKERSYVGGHLDISVQVRKNVDTEWIIGLLLLTLKDVQRGYLAIGGQTGIGKGIFQENGSILLDEKEVEEQKYLTECLRMIEEVESA